MRNNTLAIRSQLGRQTIDVTVFHGGDRLFTEFEPGHSRLKRDVGFWFAADEGYCNSHGGFVYECRIRAEGVSWLDGPDFLEIEPARAKGICCQIGIYEEPILDALVTCNDPTKIEILRVFDPELGEYIEAADIEDRIAELNAMRHQPNAASSVGQLLAGRP
ncbi:hypothetical protein OIU34_23760 [Pararhizobium sp. BT-229]|uniref:hypothetical protein n=1 Tax=Pararhizobium sp. BT-229 TaxID=2986923 RepID=UPI0021F74E7D|nr:hypothetical protein [Pararhizobium sp. BT-229]MCV9964914.1 hypothetical protein [Pararhizobium sp. BT-229]